MQALFQLDAQGGDALDQTHALLDEADLDAETKSFAAGLVRGAWQRRDHLDEHIAQASQRWSVTRMGGVDRSLLRLGVFEMLDPDGPPHAVVINEAIELAKKYGTAESSQFVNGVLDAISKRLAAAARS